MQNVMPRKFARSVVVALMFFLIPGACYAAGGEGGWEREEVDLGMSGPGRIKAIRYPKAGGSPTRSGRRAQPGKHPGKGSGKGPSENSNKKNGKPASPKHRRGPKHADGGDTPSVSVLSNIVNSPPVDGFVPWVVVTTTDERLGDGEFEAVVEVGPVDNFTADNPQTDYAIGIFDTGASANVLSYEAAMDADLYNGYVTINSIELAGASSSVFAMVSEPIGIFIDGLDALDPTGVTDANGLLIDTSGMVGETNVCIVVGQNPGSSSSDLPTVIGSPMSVFYTTRIRNDRQVTATHKNERFTGPEMTFYEQDDLSAPSYPDFIPLELKPLGSSTVMYLGFPDLTTFEFVPYAPSVIMGNLSQSLFFVHSVDMVEGENVAYDKDRFMLDTGAQVTVIGSRIAARLGLDPAEPNFIVEIHDVTGDVSDAPGFYIDSVEIPGVGEWLKYKDVPVILLDIFSPEGGTLDGIIGMNLFMEYNIILRGGGMMLRDDPKLEFERIVPIPGDIAPLGGDGRVTRPDLIAMAGAWLSVPSSDNWYQLADIAPVGAPDNIIDIRDFAVMSEHWQEGIDP